MNRVSKILVVEDNEIHADLVFRHLRKISRQPSSYVSEMERAACLKDALDALERETFVAVLLDLSLPDSPIHETLEKVTSAFPSLPVIALTSLNDLDFATKAVQDGAQDYLVKTDLNPHVLQRSIRYSIERKRAQDQLQQYATELEQSNQHLENFAQTLAHEIRSPLNVISGCLQLLKMNDDVQPDEQASASIADSLLAINGIAELVEELLEFSQVNSGGREHGLVELEQVFFHVYTLVMPLIKESGATVTHDPLPVVNGNEPQLRQVLQNLLINAIKYRGTDPPEIHVGVKETQQAWMITVTDNGVGIASEHFEQIFQAFARLENTAHLSGTGIGLAFCKRIMDNHNGELKVGHRLDGKSGSVFTVQIPKLDGSKS